MKKGLGRVGPEVGERFLAALTWGVPLMGRICGEVAGELLKRVKKVGLARYAESVREGRRDRFGEDSLRSHIRGAMGEAAFCQATGREWEGLIGTFELPDVKPDFEIKTCKPGKNMHVKITSPLDRRFVLVELDGSKYMVIGWLPGAKVRDFPVTDPGDRKAPCWTVPQDSLLSPWLLVSSKVSFFEEEGPWAEITPITVTTH